MRDLHHPLALSTTLTTRSQPDPSSTHKVPADLSEKLQALRSQLASDDLGATNAHANWQPLIAALYPLYAESLRAAIDEFNFPQVTRLLDQILAY